MARRVVITGMGAVTPLGLNVETTWKALIDGRSGAGPITRFDPTGFETQIACEVKNFDPNNYLDRKEARRMDRFTHLAIAATREALDDARLTITPENADDVGIIIGSGIGGIETLSQQFKVLFDKGPERLSPFLCTMMISNMAAGHVSIVFGIRGPNHCTVSACASGAHAIGEAFETIRRGASPVMLAGGAEAPVVPIGVGTFNSMRALSTRNDAPEKASRPFDLDRDGFVIGEGAGLVVLEELEHARARDARIYAELIGYGATADAVHVTAPSEGGAGAAKAMARACAEADLSPAAIDYVNAHGTSTPLNDKAETAALRSLLGERAFQVPISSTKSMTGHLLGAAGAVEAIICVLAIQNGIVPPTINQEHPDPECDLDYVPNVARRVPVRVALSNSLGFGGHNVSLIVRAWEQ
ncbi:MAG TPA: beta-ketoacyl-ACP synthase II [Chloroflexota bacterium]|nr:beta-ketoacyl-ACP synthase II [Chloroflexota bacterium]